jgi:hypothetical protein
VDTSEKDIDMDFIQGTKFQQLAEDYEETNKGYALEYAHTHDVKDTFDAIRKDKDKKYVVITHNSDGKVKTPPGQHDADPAWLPDNVVHWYAQNVCGLHPRVSSLPIGLENNYCFPELKKVEQLRLKREEMQAGLIPRNRLAYINFNPGTNPQERQPLYKRFEDCGWATKKCVQNGRGYAEYIHDLCTHKYCLCPEGNGTDTHRLWEALYLGCIPVVQYHLNVGFYTDAYQSSTSLPILCVVKWEQLKQNLLENTTDVFSDIGWWQETETILDFKFWRDRILNT